MKGRLVIDGSTQDESSYDKMASPTANPITIMTMIHLMAVYDRECATLDVPAAFLTPPMEEGVEFYGVMDARTADLAIKVDPSLKQFQSDEGRLYFRLLKYLYGLHQASMIFYRYLTAYLLSKGMTQSRMDCSLSSTKPA